MSWLQLSCRGWKRKTNARNNRITYERPDSTIVSQSRDLTQTEKIEVGHILFPKRGRKRKVILSDPEVGHTDTAGPSTATAGPSLVISEPSPTLCMRRSSSYG